MSVLSQPRFHDEAAAFAYLESMIWANGTVCPHCGVVNGRIYDLAGVRGKPSKKNPEGAIRHGLKKCGECRKQFTAKVGTVFEDAKLPLHKTLQAVHLMVSSKKGISSHQLSRILEIQYNSAWFLSHRIREAMRSGELAVPFGTGGTPVEVDETYFGHLKGQPVRQSGAHKMKVMSLVDRATGRVQSYAFDQMISTYVEPIVRANIAREARLITDQSRLYKRMGQFFDSHETVNHSIGEYGRGDVFTNTVEGSFSIFKRGMKGVYQHCGEQHLHRYLAEFDFRYTHRVKVGYDDTARAAEAVKGIVGKRLTYQTAHLEG